MNHEQASDIIRQLADGLDPISGRALASDDPCQHPQIVRALFVARQALDRGAAPERKVKPRAEHAGLPWSEEEDRTLAGAHDAGTPVKDLADRHKRSIAAIQARLVKLGKIPATESRFRVRVPARPGSAPGEADPDRRPEVQPGTRGATARA
jgi:hypothetical protein